jgi:diguanylate cyclase (GGDEF)-like protein/PAS domain S-box-containing protein
MDDTSEGHMRRMGAGWELTPPRAEALLQALRETVTVLDGQGRILYTNRALHGFLGHDISAFDHIPIELIHPDEVDEFIALYERCMSTPGATVTGEFRMQGADGLWKIVEGSAVNMVEDPTIAAIVLITRNLSDLSRPVEEARDRSRRVRELADRDALTGLATRTRLIAATRRGLERRRSTGWQVALAILSLERYELIGTQLGQAAADSFTLDATERVLRTASPDELVARIGADTFAVLVESADAGADARATARTLRDALAAPGLPHTPDALVPRVSVVVADDGDVDADALLSRAEDLHRDRHNDRAPVVR